MPSRSTTRRRACCRSSIKVRVALVCTVGLGVVTANLLYPLQTQRMLDVFVKLAYIPLLRHSPKLESQRIRSTTTSLSADVLRYYVVLDDACLFYDRSSASSSMVVVRSNQTEMKTMIDNETGLEYIASVNFWQGREFVHHYVQLSNAPVEEFNATWAAASWHKRGTYMLTTHHTPENNFHLHNDFLLPVFHAHRALKLNGLLLLQGCVSCWATRLPMMSRVLNMMNLSMVYPLESFLHRGAIMCMDRLVIAKPIGRPFYSHKGRFSPFWTRELFVDYRDQVHAHFGKLLQEQLQQQSTDNSTTNSSDWMVINASTNNKTKPVLSWLSRGSNFDCIQRCIRNELEVVAELSKYFHVHLLSFDAGLTVEQSMAYIMNTDILIGLHGAGFGYISLLPDQAMVVELKSTFGNDKKLFLNMASSLNLPYYAVNFDETVESSGDICTLPPDVIQSLSEETFHAYQHERNNSNVIASGECLFPEQVTPQNHLSSKDHSRCYLEQPFDSEEWYQCVHFGLCV